jgi:hypothetical protein
MDEADPECGICILPMIQKKSKKLPVPISRTAEVAHEDTKTRRHEDTKKSGKSEK